ncbi:MAG TPA: hypothetical protein VM287_13625 [Egibacteraceae bacterium]|nr:hypothetical protein [Egibacteraceae bacterium]
MGAVQDATLTIGEAARRLETTIDAVLRHVYEGQLSASPELRSGRLLLQAEDVERLRERQRTG